MADSPDAPPPIALVPLDELGTFIHTVRGLRVMLDSDLAALYEVRTAELTRVVNRHPERFPEDFAFRLSREEFERLRYQSGTSNTGRGGRRYPPYAFTEQGVAMLSSVLHSARAVAVNIEIMRAFVRLRALVGSHDELARRVDALEFRYDGLFDNVFDMLSDILQPPPASRRRLGFGAPSEPAS